VPKKLEKIIRVSKVVAIVYDRAEGSLPSENRFKYFALLDGGHTVPISEMTAVELADVIGDANASDRAFFKRGG
jgi:hypothetical protein